MKKKTVILFLVAIMSYSVVLHAAENSGKVSDTDKPVITLSEDIDESVTREASKVKEEFEDKFESLAVRNPFAWDEDTLVYLYQWAISIPSKTPVMLNTAKEHSKILGISGSLILVMFMAALLYSFFWQKRVIAWIERKIRSLAKNFSHRHYAYFISVVDVITCALVPLILLCFYTLFSRLFEYQSDWFTYIGWLLWLWFGTLLVSRTFREALTNKEVSAAARSQGPRIYRWVRAIILYSALMLAVYWLVGIFKVRNDVTELISFFVSLSITLFLLLLALRKKAITAVLPKLDNPIFRRLFGFIRAFYYPLVLVTLSGALLWTFGYQDLGLAILRKIWITTLAFVAIASIHHITTALINKWFAGVKKPNEHAYKLARTSKSILLFVTVLASIIIILNLLGLLNPLQRIMSFPIMTIGDSTIHFWTILKAMIIVVSFYFAANLVQSYMDYKVYPSLGIDPGLGLVLNTTFKYLVIAVAFLIALNIIGIDLKVLLVFAGAIGIGIGLGLQNVAANIISGFIIIFGRKIRKGDWIEVDGKLGMVSDIYIRATKMKTRDDIEYLIPNTLLVSNTIINYSFSSPMIRIHVPVGVSYKSDPEKVREILTDVASRNEMLDHSYKPLIRFMEYADSALVFELLVWINVRTRPKEDVMSALYFSLFEEFKKQGIEIPFPQRDIHVKPGSELDLLKRSL